MNLYKFTNYLAYAGGILMILYIIGSLGFFHTPHGFKESDGLRYLMYVAAVMTIPYCCYRLWHFNAFKEENKHRLITWSLMLVIIVLSLILKG